MRKALHILGSLDDADVEWLGSNGTIRLLEREATLIERGRAVENLYILLDGELAVSGEHNAHIATLLPGEIVGEMSFIDERPPSASVIAKRQSRLLGIPRSLLKSRLLRDEAFAARFYRALAAFLADRLVVTVGRLGYGESPPDARADKDELSDAVMEEVSLAASRFDRLYRVLNSSA